jgi:hypothetical protein
MVSLTGVHTTEAWYFSRQILARDSAKSFLLELEALPQPAAIKIYTQTALKNIKYPLSLADLIG